MAGYLPAPGCRKDHIRRMEADITVAGTVQAPELSGVISGAELAADIPAVGLKLKEG